MIKSTKVAIIGAGAVGTATANCLLAKGISSEIVLIDINKNKALGEILDMQHSLEFQTRNVKLVAGDYDDCKDAQIVVLTVAAPFDGSLDRLLFRDKTSAILKQVVPDIMASGFEGIFIVVSNPVDVMTQLVQKLSGVDNSRVIGSGTILETARLKYNIGQIMNVNPKSIDAYVIGEHGESLVIPWSHVSVGGKNFLEIVKDNKDKYKNISLQEIYDKTKNAGHEIMKAKGNTQFGIASGVVAIISAILQDECKTLPVCSYVDGQYGINDTYCGVPAIIGKDGIIDIGIFNLTDEEQDKFINSAKVIKDSFDGINL